MRYESFYPFARQQSQPTSMGQTSFGSPPQMAQPQPPRQPFMNDPMSNSPGGAMGNPFGGPMSNSPEGPMGNPFGGPVGNSPGGPVPGQGGQQSPSRMESYMQTANQFLNTAQQFAPMVQQFAPMVQNLPAMWRLYKGFQSLPAAGVASFPASGASAARSVVANAAPGLSVPRVFQPPTR